MEGRPTSSGTGTSTSSSRNGATSRRGASRRGRSPLGPAHRDSDRGRLWCYVGLLAWGRIASTEFHAERTPSMNERTIARRALLVRAGLVGGAVWIAPVLRVVPASASPA